MPLRVRLSRQVVSSNINGVESLNRERKMARVAPTIFTTDAAGIDGVIAEDFLGFTFRYDRDFCGGDKTYLNVTLSLNSATRAKYSGI